MIAKKNILTVGIFVSFVSFAGIVMNVVSRHALMAAAM